MALALNTKPYILKKGDTLEGIAKRHGHKDGKAIWNAGANKTLVAKRKKPEQLQPGDSLVIPPIPSQIKQIENEIAALNKARDANARLAEALGNDAIRLKAQVKLFDRLIDDSQKTTDQIVEELNQNLRGMKKWADGVDAAKTLIDIGRTLTKLVGLGAKAMKESGEKLAELNEKALEEAADLASKPVTEGGPKILASMKDSATTGLAFVGTVAESWEKIGSPSFWANTWVQMTQNGKSWSDAVSSDIGEDIADRIKLVQRQSAEHIHKIRETQKSVAAQLATTQKLVRECEQRIKMNEDDLAMLPDLSAFK